MAALAARSVAAAVEDADEDTDVPEEEVVDYPPARSRLLTNYALSPGWGGDEVLVDGDGESMHPPVRLASPSASRGGVPNASPDQHVNFGGTTEELGDAEADTDGPSAVRSAAALSAAAVAAPRACDSSSVSAWIRASIVAFSLASRAT